MLPAIENGLIIMEDEFTELTTGIKGNLIKKELKMIKYGLNKLEQAISRTTMMKEELTF